MLLLQPWPIAHFHPEPKIRMNIRTFDPVNVEGSKSWCIQSSESTKEKGILLPQNPQQPPVVTDDPEEVRSQVDVDDASVSSSK